jgi:endo-1,4-beta-xylanase
MMAAALILSFLAIPSLTAGFPFHPSQFFPANSPSKTLSARQAITTSQTGTNNGFYYSFWNAGGGTVAYTNLAGGEYSVTWTDCNNFVAGKGWNPGSAQAIT